MIFWATTRVAGLSVNSIPNFPHIVSSFRLKSLTREKWSELRPCRIRAVHAHESEWCSGRSLLINRIFVCEIEHSGFVQRSFNSRSGLFAISPSQNLSFTNRAHCRKRRWSRRTCQGFSRSPYRPARGTCRLPWRRRPRRQDHQHARRTRRDGSRRISPSCLSYCKSTNLRLVRHSLVSANSNSLPSPDLIGIGVVNQGDHDVQGADALIAWQPRATAEASV